MVKHLAEKVALVIIADLIFFSLALIVSGVTNTATAGTLAVQYGPSTTIISSNGNETITEHNQLVNMSATEVTGLWLLFVGLVFLFDYIVFVAERLIPKFPKIITFTVRKPMPPDAVDRATGWFKERLQERSQELVDEAKDKS